MSANRDLELPASAPPIEALLLRLAALHAEIAALETSLARQFVEARPPRWTGTAHAFAAVGCHGDALAALFGRPAPQSVRASARLEPDPIEVEDPPLSETAPAESVGDEILPADEMEGLEPYTIAAVHDDQAAPTSELCAGEDTEGLTADLAAPEDREPSIDIGATLAAASAAAFPDNIIPFRPLSTAAHDFTLIRGVDRAAADVLLSFGLTQFRDIAAFQPEDVATIDAVLADPGRVSREGWIEQAAILAKGQTTAFARARLDAEATATTAVALAAAKALSTPATETPGKAKEKTSNVIPFRRSAARPRHARAAIRLATAAASLSLLAAASASTFGMTPDLGALWASISCSDTFSSFVQSCRRMSWIPE